MVMKQKQHRLGNTVNKQNTTKQTKSFPAVSIGSVLFTSLKNTTFLDLLYKVLPLDSQAKKAVLST